MPEVAPEYLEAWNTKPVLRTVYDDFYQRIVAACVPGLTIEVGGGIGNVKQRLPQVVSTDIQFGSRLDCVADAQRLPFGADVATNIVMVDVLHHIEFPPLFFREAARVLRPGGHLILLEIASPRAPLLRWLHGLYFRRIVPVLGAILADRAAYAYLPASAAYLPSESALRGLLEDAGFTAVERRLLGAGSVQLVTARAEPAAEAA